MNEIHIDIHADDYGYTLHTSKDILDCMKKGLLDSISIIPNTSYFDDSMELLFKEIPNLPFLPKISIHLNFVEGYNLSNTSLLSNNGVNCTSWIDIFVASLGGMKKVLKDQIKKEIKNQIDKGNKAIEKCIAIANNNNIKYEQKGIRIDSHTHVHPIPLVFNALLEVIDEEQYEVEYIRNPKEPIIPFIREYTLWKTYRPINFIKNIILNIFSHNIDKYCDIHKIQKIYMWGLIMSGEMDYERIKCLLPKIKKYATRKNRNLEILFHPGIVKKEEITFEFNKENIEQFNLSNNREIEKDAVYRIKNLYVREGNKRVVNTN